MASRAACGRLNLEGKSLMACRTKFVTSKPLKEVNVTFSPGRTTRTSGLVETLNTLGSDVSLCPNSISSTVDSGVVLEIRTTEEYWLYIARLLERCPDIIVDQSGDLIQLLHEGEKAEKEFVNTGRVPDHACTDDMSFKAMLAVIVEGLNSDPQRYHKIKQGIVAATAETFTGAKMLWQMEHSGTLTFPAMIVPEIQDLILFNMTNQVFALVELWNERSSGKYANKVNEFARHLDEKVAALHLEMLGENQADDYICLQMEDDHQPANNRYGAKKCLKVCVEVLSSLAAISGVVRFIQGIISGDFQGS